MTKSLYKNKYAWILLVASVIWGFAFSAQVFAAQKGLGSFAFNGTRFFIGGLALVPVVFCLERKPNGYSMQKHTVLPAIGAGVIMYVAVNLQQLGIDMTHSAGKASFITGLYIVLVPILSLVLFRRRAGVFVWIGAFVAVVGLYLLGVEPNVGIELGDLLVLVAAVLWACHILWVDRFVERANPIRFSMVQFFVCGILGLCTAFFVEDVTVTALLDAKWEILYAGIISSGIGYTCQIIGQKGVPPTPAAMIMSMESVFGALGGVLFAGERLPARVWLGCALMFAGIILSQVKRKESVGNE